MNKKMISTKQNLSIFIILIASLYFSCSFKKSVINPEIVNTTPSSIKIAWTSKNPYKGKVFYHPAGTSEKPQLVEEKFDHSFTHEVRIDGLTAGKQYIYWINNSKKKYFFRTMPDDVKSFSFLIALDNLSGRISSLLMSEMPEFILSFSNKRHEKDEQFKAIKPYVPTYDLKGQTSIYIKDSKDLKKNSPWKLDWGGLTMIFIDNDNELNTFLSSPKAHTIGIFLRTKTEFSKNSLATSMLHSLILKHNRSFPSNKIAFVITQGSKIKKFEINKINYVQMPPVEKLDKKNSAVRVDVNIETTYAVLLDTKDEITLNQPPLKKQRTCTECRRLASIGSYKESVAAYKEFIKNNKGHYQIDDAYYAIAEIMDTKLFQFQDAVQWYKELLKKYPNSTLTPLAKQRVEFISKYSDNNYEPLNKFEKIRRVEYIKAKNNPKEKEKVLAKAKAIIEKYQHTEIAPIIFYWLANQYRDINIQKAKDNYLALLKKFPNHQYSRGIWWEIGETYYSLQKYNEAIDAFKEALKNMPSSSVEIKAQIKRAERNLRRKHLAYICLLLPILILILSLSFSPAGIEKNKFLTAAISFAIILIIFFFGSWLVMEQFASNAEMIKITTGFAAAFTLGFPFAFALSNKIISKIKSDQTSAVPITGIIINLIFAFSVLYITLFYTNEHFLIIFNL